MFPPPYGQPGELYPPNPLQPNTSNAASYPPASSGLPGQPGQYAPPPSGLGPPPHYMGTPYEYNYGYFPPNYPPFNSSSV